MAFPARGQWQLQLKTAATRRVLHELPVHISGLAPAKISELAAVTFH
jgi:hypothetical protein